MHGSNQAYLNFQIDAAQPEYKEKTKAHVSKKAQEKAERTLRRFSDNPIRLLRLLGHRTDRQGDTFWDEVLYPTDVELGSTPELWENPNLPAGYTYLLQFIAHDIVASVVSSAVNRRLVPEIENVRSRALLLDTLYGGGPDTDLRLYRFEEVQRMFGGTVPRLFFRLGPKNTKGAETGQLLCPFRDLGRGAASIADDGEIKDEVRSKWMTEAFVADQRNDSHAFISQLTVLMKLFHNIVAGRLQKAVPTHSEWSQMELAYRQFTCARLIVTTIYRDIIKKDVLFRILDHDVYKYYRDGGETVDASEPGEIPPEFAFAGFRFGHAMIRNDYLVNSDTTSRKMTKALQLASTAVPWPGNLPLSKEWLVDWSRFFLINDRLTDRLPNWSRRIGPSIASSLAAEGAFKPIRTGEPDQRDKGGLSDRDNLSAVFADLPPASELSKKFSENGPKIHDHFRTGVWPEAIKSWLMAGRVERRPNLDRMETDIISNDPPLPFFVLFEAAHRLDPDAGLTRKGGGERLGPLGSCIVADTIWGILRDQQIFETADGEDCVLPLDDIELALEERLQKICTTFLETEDAFKEQERTSGHRDFHEVETMAQLIHALHDAGAFPVPGE